MSYAFTFDQIQNRPVAVDGAGTLGRRIALMFASRGGRVNIFDLDAANASNAVDFVKSTLPSVIEKRGSGEVGTAVAAGSLEEALTDAWLVVEAVPERLDIKIPVWGQIDAAAAPDAIFTTNSSSFPSREMNENVRDKTRMCNMHFYMPPDANAVDLMSDSQTAPEVMATLQQVLPEFDIHPFIARRESVGFIFNRIWAAIKRESLAVVDEGVARPEDVDGMFRLNMHSKKGPFQMMDQVGLDVVLDIEQHYVSVNPSLPTGPRDLLKKYVAAGKLGVKSGSGFYSYDKDGNPTSDQETQQPS